MARWAKFENITSWIYEKSSCTIKVLKSDLTEMILPFDRILLLSDDTHIKVQNIPPTVPLVKLDTHHHETEKKMEKKP